MADALTSLFAAVADQRIPGGCPDCAAEQTLTEELPGLWKLTIAHDDTCPALRNREAGR